MKRSITGFITRRLKLKVNEAKSAVARPVERKFLGFSFTEREVKRRIAAKAIVRFKQKVRELGTDTRHQSRADDEGTVQLPAWLEGYFGFCETPSVLESLDQWIRRRLRSVIWKQWKRSTVRFARLRAWSEQRPGGSNNRECSRPLARSQQPRAELCVSYCLLRLARTSSVVRSSLAQSIRTAGCGPACPVVWQGRAGDRSPYADLPRPHFKFQEPPMPKNKVNDLITDQEMAFARLVLSGAMTDRQAAEAVGLNSDSAAYTKAKPRVRAYMLEHRAAVQQQLAQQEG